MLDWAGTVKLLDLGLARFARTADNVTQAGDSKTVLGTADSLSAWNRPAALWWTAGPTFYALGSVAYFVLTGKPPFDGGSVAQKLIRHQTEMPALVTAQRPEVPANLAAVVARMLAKDPAARPQTAGRVIAELRPWVADVPPPTPDEMPPTRYDPGQDMDTKARHSTMALMSKSSRDLLLKTMIAAE